jgi:hypothetical protein
VSNKTHTPPTAFCRVTDGIQHGQDLFDAICDMHREWGTELQPLPLGLGQGRQQGKVDFTPNCHPGILDAAEPPI